VCIIRNIKVGERLVGDEQPTYIVAEIGSNFDGDLEQAQKMVDLAKDAGADAVKFQSFLADKIVSRFGFKDLQMSFQAKWKKPVYEVYKEAEFPREWHIDIAEHCQKRGIEFLSTPYDEEAVDLLNELEAPCFKIGSGDINYLPLVKYTAAKGKPIILGTGASTLGEVEKAVDAIRSVGNEDIILLHCVSNYPSPIEQANVRAMVTMREAFQVNVGLSDHSPGFLAPLAAVALGACIVEKHFTSDKTRKGPDHSFAMNIAEFAEMVENIRLVEKALGSPIKRPVSSEVETIIIQRRCIYAKENIPRGAIVRKNMLEILRPDKGLKPENMDLVIGMRARKNIQKGDALTWDMLQDA
jgi:N-acetylneuraminate synthase